MLMSLAQSTPAEPPALSLPLKELLVLKSLTQSTPAEPPALSLPFVLAMALVLQSLALPMTSLSPVLQSLARQPRPPTDLFCLTLVPSTASASRP